MATIKVNIRQNSGTTFEINVDPKSTVADLKKACAEQAGISAEEQRLIFKGILKSHLF
jgi:translation initiation factor 2 beta subunit (eIF-2beta)/eIF-5